MLKQVAWKFANTDTKLCVFGYVRENASIMGVNHIPSDVTLICINYYFRHCEYFQSRGKSTDNIAVNETRNFVYAKNDKLYNAIYGWRKIYIKAKAYRAYKWEFKIWQIEIDNSGNTASEFGIGITRNTGQAWLNSNSSWDSLSTFCLFTNRGKVFPSTLNTPKGIKWKNGDLLELTLVKYVDKDRTDEEDKLSDWRKVSSCELYLKPYHVLILKVNGKKSAKIWIADSIAKNSYHLVALMTEKGQAIELIDFDMLKECEMCDD